MGSSDNVSTLIQAVSTLPALPPNLDLLKRRAPRQYEVLKYVCRYKQQHGGNSPTYTNIADAFHMSISNAYAKVRLLERRGLVELDANRNIMVVGAKYLPPPGLCI